MWAKPIPHTNTYIHTDAHIAEEKEMAIWSRHRANTEENKSRKPICQSSSSSQLQKPHRSDHAMAVWVCISHAPLHLLLPMLPAYYMCIACVSVLDCISIRDDVRVANKLYLGYGWKRAMGATKKRHSSVAVVLRCCVYVCICSIRGVTQNHPLDYPSFSARYYTVFWSVFIWYAGKYIPEGFVSRTLN